MLPQFGAQGGSLAFGLRFWPMLWHIAVHAVRWIKAAISFKKLSFDIKWYACIPKS